MSDNEINELLADVCQTIGIREPQIPEEGTPTAPYNDAEIEDMFSEGINVEQEQVDIEGAPELTDEQLEVEFNQPTPNEEIEELRATDMHFRHSEEQLTPDIETPIVEGNADMPETAEAQFFNGTYASNSASFLERETTSRFKGADWYSIVQKQTLILAGLGGIGSWTSLLLSRMRPKAMFIYDADKVELANMSGQLFGMSDIAHTKASACNSNAMNFSDYHDMFCFEEFFTEESEPADIMICGFDSMAARKTFFSRWLDQLAMKVSKEDLQYCLFIDGRMSAESIQIFAFTGDDERAIQKYKQEWLFDDSEADATVCSYKQTTYCAAMIGALINNLFVNFCTNLGNPNIPRYLPFMTSYEADMMYLKTEA